jgi:hypothetical protein
MVDPGYPGALQKLRTTGAHIVPVPVDEDGLIVQIGGELAPKRSSPLSYLSVLDECIGETNRGELSVTHELHRVLPGSHRGYVGIRLGHTPACSPTLD